MIKINLKIGILVSFIMLAFMTLSAAPPKTIEYNGKNYYINGINVPWNAFGSDAGTHYEWGPLFDEQFFETFFNECKSYGVNCVRLWIHCDGRSTPEFDDNSTVVGLDTNFLSDLDAIFTIARNNRVMVMPCLWSFDMTKDFTADAGKYGGLHAELIKDTVKTRSYLDKALIPMVKRFKDTENLFAWEIINEPEWSIEGPGTTPQKVTAQEMVRFCGMIANAIHDHSDKMVTVGSACLKWHSNRQPPAESHFWSDSSFKTAYDKPGSYLDFYQIHYYDWMYNESWGYDPFQIGKSPEYWNLDKPVIIGESPGEDGKYTVKQMIDNAFKNGYAGIMPWSYFAKDGHGTWDEVKEYLKAFRDAHPELVDYKPSEVPVKRRIYFSGKNSFPINKNVIVSFYDLNGRKLKTVNNIKSLSRFRWPEKMLVYQFHDYRGHIIKTGKILSSATKSQYTER